MMWATLVPIFFTSLVFIESKVGGNYKNAPKTWEAAVMVTLEICGIPVDFPFQPYDSQMIYMEKVIQSLTSKQNAILESPTGTGKTLCLLCATLAWRRHVKKSLRSSAQITGSSLAYEGHDTGDEEQHDERIPRIIYSSRTHSQLKQVVQELKNTDYNPSVSVLGSREHLCVNEKIMQLKGTRQNLACRSAVKNRKCTFKLGFDAVKGRKMKLPILDIEEIVDKMKEKQICPFFLTRTMLPDADLVFVPYNYLIDPIARKAIGISLENAVLIFDEAHNVESVASEAASYAVSSDDLHGCIAEVQKFIQALADNQINLPPSSTLSRESAETLKALLIEIDKGLNAFPLSSSGGFTKPGTYIFEFFQQFNVNFDTCPLVLGIVEEIIELLNEGNDQRTAASKLDALLSFLGTIFRNKDKHLQAAKNYRVHIQEVVERNQNPSARGFNSRKIGTKTRVFNYWCFHPGVSFEEIASNNVYNVILTSGTLSPLETTIKELGISFPVRLENNHVIDASQVWVGVVGKGVTGKRLNSSYNSRSTDEYLVELGNTIVNFARLVPNGLLVFFPSYGILEESIERWRKPTTVDSPAAIWDRISQLKEVFVEPRGRLDFKAVVDEYHETIKHNPAGAIFFAVCRGKVSEGIDFSNEKGRAVVITGLPFPPTKDPKIMLKKSILDEAVVAPGEMKLTGNNWYIQQAARAVNQAIGRVIRHRHDYGAIILCDERFALQQQQKCLSKWLQPYCRSMNTYGEAHVGLLRFFKGNQGKQPPKKLDPELAPVPPVVNRPFKSPVLKRNTTESEPVTSTNAAIGDGQSYVDPQLLRQVTHSTPPEATAEANRPSVVSVNQATEPPPQLSKKRSLGSVFTASRSSMVQSTSSIMRPFVPPRPQPRLDPSAAVVDLTVGETEPPSSRVSSTTRKPDPASVALFPSVARKVLSAPEVASLYEIIRRLHAGDGIDEALTTMCELLRSPDRHELLEHMPKVLNGSIRHRFVERTRELGLTLALNEHHIGSSDAAVEIDAKPRDGGVATFFERLQQQQSKRRKQLASSSQRAAAVVKDPQCLVCLEISRKAYAATCGHICCLPCWQKMEQDGFTSCPMCKAPFQSAQLSLIRAARAESAPLLASGSGDNGGSGDGGDAHVDGPH